MKRNSSQLAEKCFDVLVVGSGIYGAFLAREAALRGLSVGLIEQQDFGAGTSANSLKVVHGGLRYLQHLNLLRMRESIRARRQLLCLAPYLVKPKAFIVPTYGWRMQSKWLMRAALLINDVISLDRNKGLAAAQRIPAGRVLSRRQCLAQIPGVDQVHLSGAAQWSDGFIEDTERLMIAIIHSAAELGARVVNYVSAQRYILQDGRVSGVIAEDRLTGHTMEIQARIVINAAGPGAAALDAELNIHSNRQQETEQLAWVKAFNIFIKRPLFKNAGIGLSSATRYADTDALINRGNRLYFFVPWKGGTLVGTDYTATEMATESDDGPVKLEDDELAVMIDEINTLYPDAAISKQDIGFCHAGLLPASSTDTDIDAASRLLKHSRVTDYQDASGIAGLITVTGIKYTVASQTVIDIIDRVADRLEVDAPRPRHEPVLFGAENDITGMDKGLDTRLYQRYGQRCYEVEKIAENEPAYAEPLSRDTMTTAAEVIYAIREEMAMSLSDVVYRRTGLAETGRPDQAAVLRCAEIMAAELCWSQQQLTEQLSALEGQGPCQAG